MKGAIFDMDGTLLDSMGAWDQAIPLFLERQGICQWDHINEEIAAMTFEDGAQHIIKRFSLSMLAQDVMDQLNQLMLENYLHTIEVKPGVISYLQKLREEGVAMCVATATDRALALPALRKQGILDFFSFVLTVEEVGVGKERPDIFLHCAQRLGLPPKDCRVYEDALHGLKAAKSAGFLTCGVEDAGSAAVNQDQIKRMSDIYITSFIELL